MTTRTLSVLASSLVLVALVCGPVRAERFELGMGSSGLWTRSGSADALTEQSFGMFSLSGAMKIDALQRLPGFEVLLEGTGEIGGTTGTTFQTMETSTLVHVGLFGAKLRRHLVHRLYAQGRAALGIGRIRARVSDLYTGVDPLEDAALTPAAYLGTGAEYMLARLRKSDGNTAFTLGLRFELGYLLLAPVELTPTPRREDDDTIRIPAMSTSFGDLDLSAVNIHFQIVGRF